MESIGSTAAAATATAPFIFSLKPKEPSRRFLRFSISPKNNGSEPDLRSDSPTGDSTSIVPIISRDAAMGLVMGAANVRGWTTGSGMEGPPVPAESDSGTGSDRISTFPWSLFTKSPRRRMRVAFTCNVCGQRTTRAINPHAYTDGTVFVQCCGCNVFHKLVDNLNLFHEMKCYVDPSFNPNANANMGGFEYIDFNDGNNGDDDDFPVQ